MPAARKSGSVPGAARRAGGALLPILGDQPDRRHPALARLDRARDCVLFVETTGEAAHVWSHKARIALFFAAMRRFAAELAAQGYAAEYLRIGTRAFAWLAHGYAHQTQRLTRTALMAKNAGRLSVAERVVIRGEAERIDARRDSL